MFYAIWLSIATGAGASTWLKATACTGCEQMASLLRFCWMKNRIISRMSVRRFLKTLALAALLPALFSCDKEIKTPVEIPDTAIEKIDILALGDSYTKGEGISWANNFPNQLVDSLRRRGKTVAGLRVIAQTGWRTDQLKNAIAAASDLNDSIFSVVTLCIGVNNQFQKASLDTYRTEFEALLKTALDFAGGNPKRVFVLSIPDWAYTPFGQNYGVPAQTSTEIDRFNTVNKAITGQYGTNYLNVTDISRQGLQQSGLVAADGLHPSTAQYTAWIEGLLPAVEAAVE